MAADALSRERKGLPCPDIAGGNVRLMHRWNEASDIEWAYLVTPGKRRGTLRVKACPTRWNSVHGGVMLRSAAYDGDLLRFLAKYGSPLADVQVSGERGAGGGAYEARPPLPRDRARMDGVESLH